MNENLREENITGEPSVGSPQSDGSCGSSHSSSTSASASTREYPPIDLGYTSDFKIKRQLQENKQDEIIIDLLPLAKRIGGKYGADAYHEAIEALVEHVRVLHELEHEGYIRHLSKCMKGKVQTWRASQSYVRMPEWFHRFMRKGGREEELRQEYVDVYEVENHNDLIIEQCHYTDLFEIIDKNLDARQMHVFRGRMCGFTDDEIAKEMGVCQKTVCNIKTDIMEKLRHLLRRLIT